MTHLLANLGWVDCSTVCPILLGLVGIWQKWLKSGKMVEHLKTQTQPMLARRWVTLYNYKFQGFLNKFHKID